MKIKTTSLQYKIVDSIWDRPSNNLCIYFCQLMGALLLYAFLGLMAVGAFVLPYTMFFVRDFDNLSGFVVAIAALGIFSWAAMATCLVAVICLVIEKTFKFVFGGESVAGEYVKAKKERICPRIDYTGDEE